MQPHRLSSTLKTTLQLSLGILIYIIALPIFTTWRLLLCLLLPTPLYTPALTHYNQTWTSLKSLSFMEPLVRYWTRIVALTLLLLQALLSLTLLTKSSLLFIPWLIHHMQNTSYNTQHHGPWLNNLLLHIIAFLATCAPFSSLLGTGVGVLYYARKVFVYGRFRKTMVRNPGGRGYYMPEKRKEGGHKEGGKTVLGCMANALQHLVHPHAVQVPFEEAMVSPVTTENVSPYGRLGYSEDVIFQQPGDIRVEMGDSAVRHVVVQKPEPVARFDSNPYTWHGVMSIWSSKKSGYDGRDVRRRNFEEEVEMEDRSCGEQV